VTTKPITRQHLFNLLLKSSHYFVILVCFFVSACSEQATVSSKTTTIEDQAKAITIIRDKWGIAHIYGKTDAMKVDT